MTTVREIMWTELVTIDAMNHMLFGGFRHLPVVESGAVAGVISMRDLARSMTTR